MRPPELLAEFASGEDALAAGRFLRASGCRLDLYAPHGLRGASEVIGRRRSLVPLITLLGGVTGGLVGYLILWWCTCVDYPLSVGGMPHHPVAAFIPITFESTVLGASVSGFVAALLGSGLPRLWHPVFTVAGFERASIDRYFLEIAGASDAAAVRRELARYGVLRVVALEPAP